MYAAGASSTIPSRVRLFIYIPLDSSIVFTISAVTTDFTDYTRLGIITSKGSDTKDVVLFPEKINDKYIFLHRPTSWVGPKFGVDKPNIWLGEGDALTSFEKHTIVLKPEYEWEDSRIGSGPPPIKTKKGWLLIYHGVDKNLVYSAGAALLDLSNPTRVVGRTENPIFEPEEPFEKSGRINNVVFPTGSCIIDDQLYLYYGAADKVCCVATVKLDSFTLLLGLKPFALITILNPGSAGPQVGETCTIGAPKTELV